MAENDAFMKGLELSALKKAAPVQLDLMRPGNGTPWEDRGSSNVVYAYLVTFWKSLFSHGLLLDHIRRPETTGDATAFARISIIMWVIGIFAWNFYQSTLYPTATVEMEDQGYFWLTAAGQAALVAVGWIVFLRYGTRMYIALGGNEIKGATPNLIFNCFAYSMGPSLFAVVPIFGQGLALLWIFVDLMIAGKKRLFIRGPSPIINVILIFVSAGAIAVALYFALGWFWGSYLDMSGLHEIVVEKKAASPYQPSH